MIKLTQILSKSKDVENLVIIPGGPGLSSLTLRSLDLLSKNFNLIYVDLPGTNSNPYKKKYSFKEITNKLKIEIAKYQPSHILGHSYGGYFAIELANNLNCKSLTCISTPLTEQSLKKVHSNYYENMTDNLKQAEAKWTLHQDNKSFTKWLSEYGKMYFSNPELKNIIETDPASSELFLNIRNERIDTELMLKELQFKKIKKFYLMGKQDLLLDKTISRTDAKENNFKFIEINGASHFLTCDQPVTASGIIKFLLTNE